MKRDKIGYALALSLLGLANVCIWIVPLFKRGALYLGGHYRLPHIYFGIPLLLAFVAAGVLWRTRPPRRQRALQLTTAFLAITGTLYGADLFYVLLGEALLGAPNTDLWIYDSGLSTKDNLPDPELGFRRRPHIYWKGPPIPGSPEVIYRTDEDGFRNPPGLQSADVAFIGDSFVEGASVPEEASFVQRVAQSTGLAVVNLGRNYSGPPQYLIFLERYALKYHPRAAVVALFEGNDLNDAATFARWREHPESRQTLGQRYASRSLFARLLPRLETKGKPARPFRITADDSMGATHLDYTYVPDAPAREPLGWSETARAVEEVQRVCRAQDIELLFLFIPIKVRVLAPYVEFQGEQDRELWLPEGTMNDPRDFETASVGLCQRLGCTLIDLTPALSRRAAADNRHVFFTTEDSHLDVDGHQVVADAVSEWLSARHITKGSASGSNSQELRTELR
jgi:hypothetical protein